MTYYKKKPKTMYRKKKKTSSVRKMVKKTVLSLAEKKYFVWSLSAQQVSVLSSTSVFTAMTDIPQGSTDSTRNGDRLRLSNFRFCYTIRSGASSAAYTNVRVILLQWHDPTSFSANNLLHDTTDGDMSITTPWVHDDKQAGRFKILYNKIHPMGPGSTGVNGSNTAIVTRCVSLKPKMAYMQFFGGSTTTASNRVYLLVYSTIGIASSPPTFTSEFHTQFTDL